MIKKYTQIYEILKTLKYDEYLIDKRNKIHSELFNSAVDSLLKDTSNLLYAYNHHTIIEQPDGTEVYDTKTYIKNIQNTHKTPISEIFALSLFQNNITAPNHTKELLRQQFKIIELKDSTWYMPSSVLFIYSYKNLETGKIEKIKFGPYVLHNYWNSSYIINRKDINELILGDIYVELEIIYIDYIKGSISIYDRGENRTFVVDIDYINSDIKISDEYDGRMYSVLRKRN